MNEYLAGLDLLHNLLRLGMGMDAPRLKRAYYFAAIAEFLRQEPQTILGHLAQHHPHDLDSLQRNTWLTQIDLLKRELLAIGDGWIGFEFSIPRMGKRADAIVLFQGVVFVLEFKIGAERFDASAIDQVTDYALDLKNFHDGSYSRIIVPVLIATEAAPKAVQLNFFPNADDRVAEPIFSNGERLGEMLTAAARRFSGEPSLDAMQWLASGYKPTPTIVEAAQALYKSHRVEEITRREAQNLSITTNRLSAIIDDAKANHRKVICFVTGVPGAGKTLAGLDLVTGRVQQHADEHAVFLSGNVPLVDVLREALARDQAANTPSTTMDQARRKVRSFIQPIHHFRDASLQSLAAPVEHVTVFDEAQRAWNLSKIKRFMRRQRGEDFDQSEPEFLIGVMNRHQDWCAIICLVGGGQEIHDGEAGLLEWFDALKRAYPDWKVYTSDQLTRPVYTWGHNLTAKLVGLDHSVEADLHLAVAVRSFRAESLAHFVDAVIAGDAAAAADLYGAIGHVYSIHLTRHLPTARDWLRAKARGSERFGLVASSGASRLKPEGLNVHEKVDAPVWFLNPKSDVRSSFYLEDPATEFDIQGLELDWVGVCWDADFRHNGQNWSCHKFQGTKWQTVKNDAAQRYLANAYRVLLTRARQGLVIFVPRGDEGDPTRPPAFYDGIAVYLTRCGIPSLDDMPAAG